MIGVPHRFVISEKTLANEVIEYKQRTSEDAEIISEKDINKVLDSIA